MATKTQSPRPHGTFRLGLGLRSPSRTAATGSGTTTPANGKDGEDRWYIPYNGPYTLPAPTAARPRDSWGIVSPVDDVFAPGPSSTSPRQTPGTGTGIGGMPLPVSRGGIPSSPPSSGVGARASLIGFFSGLGSSAKRVTMSPKPSAESLRIHGQRSPMLLAISESRGENKGANLSRKRSSSSPAGHLPTMRQHQHQQQHPSSQPRTMLAPVVVSRDYGHEPTSPVSPVDPSYSPRSPTAFPQHSSSRIRNLPTQLVVSPPPPPSESGPSSAVTASSSSGLPTSRDRDRDFGHASPPPPAASDMSHHPYASPFSAPAAGTTFAAQMYEPIQSQLQPQQHQQQYPHLRAGSSSPAKRDRIQASNPNMNGTHSQSQTHPQARGHAATLSAPDAYRRSLHGSASTPNLRRSAPSPSKSPQPPPMPKREKWLSPETWCDALLFPRPRFRLHKRGGDHSPEILGIDGLPRRSEAGGAGAGGLGGVNGGVNGNVNVHVHGNEQMPMMSPATSIGGMMPFATAATYFDPVASGSGSGPMPASSSVPLQQSVSLPPALTPSTAPTPMQRMERMQVPTSSQTKRLDKRKSRSYNDLAAAAALPLTNHMLMPMPVIRREPTDSTPPSADAELAAVGAQSNVGGGTGNINGNGNLMPTPMPAIRREPTDTSPPSAFVGPFAKTGNGPSNGNVEGNGRSKRYSWDDLSIPSVVPSLTTVIADGERLASDRAKWKAQAQKSLGNSAARSRARSLSRSGGSGWGGARIGGNGGGGGGAKKALDVLAAKTLLGTQAASVPAVHVRFDAGVAASSTLGSSSHRRSHSATYSQGTRASHARTNSKGSSLAPPGHAVGGGVGDGHHRTESLGRAALKAAACGLGGVPESPMLGTAPGHGAGNGNGISPVNSRTLPIRQLPHAGIAGSASAALAAMSTSNTDAARARALGSSPVPSVTSSTGANIVPGLALSPSPLPGQHAPAHSEVYEMPGHPYAQRGYAARRTSPTKETDPSKEEYAGPHPSSVPAAPASSANGGPAADLVARHRLPPQATLGLGHGRTPGSVQMSHPYAPHRSVEEDQEGEQSSAHGHGLGHQQQWKAEPKKVEIVHGPGPVQAPMQARMQHPFAPHRAPSLAPSQNPNPNQLPSQGQDVGPSTKMYAAVPATGRVREIAPNELSYSPFGGTPEPSTPLGGRSHAYAYAYRQSYVEKSELVGMGDALEYALLRTQRSKDSGLGSSESPGDQDHAHAHAHQASSPPPEFETPHTPQVLDRDPARPAMQHKGSSGFMSNRTFASSPSDHVNPPQFRLSQLPASPSPLPPHGAVIKATPSPPRGFRASPPHALSSPDFTPPRAPALQDRKSSSSSASTATAGSEFSSPPMSPQPLSDDDGDLERFRNLFERPRPGETDDEDDDDDDDDSPNSPPHAMAGQPPEYFPPQAQASLAQASPASSLSAVSVMPLMQLQLQTPTKSHTRAQGSISSASPSMPAFPTSPTSTGFGPSQASSSHGLRMGSVASRASQASSAAESRLDSLARQLSQDLAALRRSRADTVRTFASTQQSESGRSGVSGVSSFTWSRHLEREFGGMLPELRGEGGELVSLPPMPALPHDLRRESDMSIGAIANGGIEDEDNEDVRGWSRFPQDIDENSRASSILEPTLRFDRGMPPPLELRIGTVASSDTPPPTKSPRRFSEHLSFLLSPSADPEPPAYEEPAPDVLAPPMSRDSLSPLTPNSDARNSTMTTASAASGASRMSALSDFPTPPATQLTPAHMSIIHSYFGSPVNTPGAHTDRTTDPFSSAVSNYVAGQTTLAPPGRGVVQAPPQSRLREQQERAPEQQIASRSTFGEDAFQGFRAPP